VTRAARARFITLEGGEGAGKSTQVKRLAAWLEARGIRTLTTREPGGAPGAEAIRNLLVNGDTGQWEPVTEAMLHYAARRDHLARTVWPAMEQGTWVISDRFADSTAIYQGAGQGVPQDILAALHRVAAGDFHPDLTLILDVPVETGLARAAARRGVGGDRYERMGTAFHERLRAGFRALAGREPERCVLIDAAQPVDGVTAAMEAVLDRKLKAWAA
jgi:dTMP kinase